MYAVDQMVPAATGTAAEVAMLATSPLPAIVDEGAADGAGSAKAEVDVRGDSCAFVEVTERQSARRRDDIADLLEGCCRAALVRCREDTRRDGPIEGSDTIMQRIYQISSLLQTLHA